MRGTVAYTIPILGSARRTVAIASNALRRAADIIVASAPDPVFVSDLGGKILHANDAVSRLLGFRQGELIEPSLSRILSPVEARGVVAAVREAAVQPGVTRSARLTPRSASGEPIPATLNASALRDREGKVIGVIGILRDMRAYEQVVRDLREARAAIRARDAFLARASHELRTPLTAALGTIRLLERTLGEGVKESPESLIAIANRNLGAMAALVNDLLDASKLASGRETLTLEPVDLAAVVRAGLEVVGAQARDKGVALRAAVPDGLTVPGDRLKLEQVLVNLLANAVTFTSARGEVAVEARVEGDSVLVRVRDTGEGIVREHLEAIFKPFFQVGRREARRPRGTGLGLAICRQIVALHGGRIWAESEGPGRGSTFIVRLPAAPVGRAQYSAA